MANRNFDIQRILGKGLTEIVGSFAPNGVSAVDLTTRQGQGWTVARTGVGAFQLTFSDLFVDLVSATANLQLAAVAASVVQIGTYVAASKTLVLTVLTEAAGALAAADVALNANNRIHFRVVFRNSDVRPKYGS